MPRTGISPAIAPLPGGKMASDFTRPPEALPAEVGATFAVRKRGKSKLVAMATLSVYLTIWQIRKHRGRRLEQLCRG
jgi:hypothetical protein